MKPTIDLQQRLNELLVTASKKANDHQEDFFQGIEGPLNKLCEAIAQEACADSAAVFFVTDEEQSGIPPYSTVVF